MDTRFRRALIRVLALALILTVSGGFAMAAAQADQADQADQGSDAQGGRIVAERAATVVDYSGVIATMRDEIPKVLATTGTVGATVALVDGDRVVWTEGFGFADKATGKPVTADTLFHIGSLSKTFTAVAVMQLVQRGKVKLDAPLARYVPEFRLLPRYRSNAITVRTVLDHHSGVPGDVFNGLFTNYRTNPGYRAWLVKALANMYPERPVNTVWAYNNSGFVLLQNLVEHVTGMSFRKYTRTRLFAPMAMPDSSFDDSLASNASLTRNYAVAVAADGTVGAPVAKPREYINGWAAGSITSNASQMANYLRMLLADGRGQTGRVLPRGTLQRMWKPQISTPLDILYFKMGLGFALGHPDLNWAGRVVQHDGATSWNNSMMQLLPDSGLGIYVSVNTSSAAGNAAPMISAKALGLAYTAKTGNPRPADAVLPISPPTPDPATTAENAGKYATGHGLDRVEATAGGRLRWTRMVGTATESSSVISLAQDGWFTPDKPGWPQARFRTIGGRKLMLIRIPWGPQVTQVMEGERVPAKTLTRAWRARLGTYRAVDANPRTTEPFKSTTARLRNINGVLVFDNVIEPGLQVLAPANAGTAFTFGLGGGLGRDKGDVIFAGRTGSGRPSLTYLGVRFVRVR